MLFVDDDHADVGERGQHRDPRSHDDASLSGPDTPPLVGALALGQRAMEQRDLGPHVVLETLQERHRQCDLGHQHERAATGGQGRAHCRRVDRALAAGRRAFEQHSGVGSRRNQRRDPVDGRRLLRCQRRLGRHGSTGRLRPAFARPPLHGHRFERQQAAPEQAGNRTRAVTLGKARGADRFRGRRQLGEQGALARAQTVVCGLRSRGQPHLALDLLARLRRPDLPVGLHAAVGTWTHHSLDTLEHARGKHVADHQRRWREVVRRDVARQRHLERRE